MYDIALSVSACTRSGTRADVAWMISPTSSDEAIAFTPGGGRIGSLAGGAFDGLLADVAGRLLPTGRRVTHIVTEVESQIANLPTGTTVEFLVVPAAAFPESFWHALLRRETLAVSARVDHDEVVAVDVIPAADAQGLVLELITAGRPVTHRVEDTLICVLAPVPRLLIAGQGPIAIALGHQAVLLGWKAIVEARPDLVAGFAATASPLDSIVVIGHDIESSSRCLLAALESDAGYIGALGSTAMQQSRADWLAYRDVTDLSRVHGPAGLDIGARTPAEIAVAIVAQIIALVD